LIRWTVQLTYDAGNDLQRIHDRIAADSPVNAAAFIKRMLDAIDGLAIVPHRSIVQKTSKRLGQSVRMLPFGAYVIYFLAYDDQRIVRVLTIRHAARRRPRF
jgi:plasmid stabilization system protein ParE